MNCPAIDGILEEAEEVTGKVEDKKSRAAIIAAGRPSSITRSPVTVVDRLGQAARTKHAPGSRTDLNEEKAADKKLTSIAESQVNLKVAS